MPVLDGYEATQSIRAIEAQKGPSVRRCPIIAMTAAVGALERQRSLEAGMDDHLAKPFDEDKINQILNDVAKMKAATSVPIDPLALAKFETLKKQVGPNAARELATIWLEDVHDRVQRLKEAFHAGLFEVVRKEGHALKGGCTIFSMDDVINACTALEKNIRDEGVPSLHLVEVIADQVESAATTLHRIISGEETASPA
jgi:CheY-like chemotaxis protein